MSSGKDRKLDLFWAGEGVENKELSNSSLSEQLLSSIGCWEVYLTPTKMKMLKKEN